MEGYLSEHTEVCSNDCESIMQIKLGKDTPLVDNVSFFTLQEDGEWIEQSVRDYQFYFKSASSDSDWDKYTLGQIVSAGDYEVKLDGDKKPSRTVDWIIKTNGEILDSWAVWGNISAGDDAEVTLDSPVDNYFVTGSTVDLTCTANATVGVTLASISLWTDAGGVWNIEDTVSLEVGFGQGWNRDTTYDDTGNKIEGGNPELYTYSGDLYIVTFSDYDAKGAEWTGSSWTYGHDFYEASDGTSGTIFETGGDMYLITGNSDGTLLGFEFDGYSFTSYTSIVSGLSDVGSDSRPEAFEKDGVLYLITGNSDGTFDGYTWSGSTWTSNSTIVGGLGDIGSYSAPEVFESDGEWYMLAGEDQNINGFNWTGGAWVSDASVKTDLPTAYEPITSSVIEFGAPGVLQMAYQKEGDSEKPLFYSIAPEEASPTQVFEIPITPGNVTWSCQACDTDSDCGFALENRTVRQKDITATSNSPVDDYETIETSFLFSCSGEAIESQLENISLWTNASGVWEAVDTNSSLTSNSSTQLFNQSIDAGNFLWACQACDSVGDCDISTSRTFIRKDVEITLNSPADNESIISNTIDFNCSATAVENQLKNITLITNITGAWEITDTIDMEDFADYPWIDNSTILNGLPTSISHADSFVKDGVTQMIVYSSGAMYSFNWTGSTWVNNSVFATGLPVISYFSVFEHNDEWYLGGSGAVMYKWNGTSWASDTAMANGFANGYPDVFNFEGELYSIIGNSGGTFTGQIWNGTSWIANSTIAAGLGDVRIYSYPKVFYRNDILQIISGSYDRGFWGFQWIDGEGWGSKELIMGTGLYGGRRCKIYPIISGDIIYAIHYSETGGLRSDVMDRSNPISDTAVFSTTVPEGDISWTCSASNLEGLTRVANENFTVAVSYPTLDISLGVATFENGIFDKDYIIIESTGDGDYLDTITNYLYNDSELVSSESTTDTNLITNFTGLADGTYYINATINNTFSDVEGTVTRTIHLDSTDPTISFVSPSTTAGTSAQSFIVANVSITEDNIDTTTIYLYNSAGLINSQVNTFYTFTGLADGVYYLNATVNDTAGNTGKTSTVEITLDTIGPVINITAPKGQRLTYVSDTNYTLEYSIAEDAENCSYVYPQINNLTSTSSFASAPVYNLSWDVRTGVMYGDYSHSYTLARSADKQYILSVGDGRVSHTRHYIPNCFIETYSTITDTNTSGVIAGDYFCYKSNEEYFLIKLIDVISEPQVFESYSLNVEINCSGNSVSFPYLYDANYIGITAEDSYNLKSIETSEWSTIVEITDETYNTATIETTTETFGIQMNYDSSAWTTVRKTLIYDGVNTTGVTVGAGDDVNVSADLFISTITTPENNTFYWELEFINATGSYIFNTNPHTQYVGLIIFTECDLIDDPQVILTTYSETEPTERLNSSIVSQWKIKNSYGGDTILSESFVDSNENKSQWAFCILPRATNYTVSITTTASAADYTSTTNYIIEDEYSSGINNISMYLLRDNASTLTKIYVTTIDNVPVKDVYVNIQRYDAITDSYYSVGGAKTDSSGEDLAYLEWYETWYKFIGTKDGEVLFTDGPRKISSSPVLLKVDYDTELHYVRFGEIEYSLTYSNSTKNFILTYIAPTGKVSNNCLKVNRINSDGQEVICDNCETSSSATIYCNIGLAGNGTFIADYYAAASAFYLIDRIEELINVQSELYAQLGNDNGTGLAILMAGIVVAMFLITPVLGVIGIVIGMILSIALGLQPMELTATAGLILVGFAVIWAVKK